MYYAGRDNEVYRKYARYRDWLYTIDDEVLKVMGISLFDLVSMSILRKWYTDCIGSYEAVMQVIVKEVA